jgi:hypothetical protein
MELTCYHSQETLGIEVALRGLFLLPLGRPRRRFVGKALLSVS